MEVLVFLFFAVGIPAIIFYSIHAAKAADKAWSLAASKLGLTYQAGGFLSSRQISGTTGGCWVHVDTYTVSHGKSSTTYTRFKVGFPSLRVPAGLRLTKQGFFSGVAKFFGAQDIKVGDGTFDDNVVVKGADPREVMGFLTEPRRVRIRRLLAHRSGAVIDSSGIEWSMTGVVRESGQMISILRSFLGTAKAIASPDEGDEGLKQALDARASGDFERARGFLKKARENREAEEVIDEALMEGELLHLEGRRGEAQAVIEEARAVLPEDPEVKAWAAEVEAAKPEPAPSEDAPLDVESLCRALFVEAESTLDANHIFESRYRGREIDWEGTLRSVQAFTIDLVLGNEAGTKALVDVHKLEEVLIGSNAVTAVVGLPKEAEADLAQHVGKRVRLRGRLVRRDAMMMNLFVKDGACDVIS